jgi:hypothetical protein
LRNTSGILAAPAKSSCFPALGKGRGTAPVPFACSTSLSVCLWREPVGFAPRRGGGTPARRRPPCLPAGRSTRDFIIIVSRASSARNLSMAGRRLALACAIRTQSMRGSRRSMTVMARAGSPRRGADYSPKYWPGCGGRALGPSPRDYDSFASGCESVHPAPRKPRPSKPRSEAFRDNPNDKGAARLRHHGRCRHYVWAWPGAGGYDTFVVLVDELPLLGLDLASSLRRSCKHGLPPRSI